MKKLFLMLALIFAFTLTANAQGWLGKLKDKAVETAKKTVEKNVEDKTEKAVDEALNKKTSKKDKSSNSKKDVDDEEEDSSQQVSKKKKKAQGEDVKSDFVPGTVVIFEDNFANEQMGEFPSKWDLISNNAEVAKMNGKKAVRLVNGSNTEITPLIKDGSKNYLPDFYTLEFDYFVTGEEDHSSCYKLLLKIDNDHHLIGFNTDRIWWSVINPNTENEVSGTKDYAEIINENDWNHFALSFNKRALKVYINDVRMINIPNAKPAEWFIFENEFWEDHLDYITNVRLAKGGVELYERNAQEMSPIEKAIAETGQFVTNNILFDTGKASLKSESMNEIQKIAEYMKKNPSVRFEVQGHTDNQGSDKINDQLSQQRAEAVVKALEGLGVDAFNLRPVGKGSHEPVADNKTEDGRAKNRRVVFIKK